MGIDIDWMMVQGATESEWEEVLSENEDFKKWDYSISCFVTEVLGMSNISPYYDSADADRIYGIEIDSGDGLTEVHLPSLAQKAEEAEKYLKEEFGLVSSTVVSQNVW